MNSKKVKILLFLVCAAACAGVITAMVVAAKQYQHARQYPLSRVYLKSLANANGQLPAFGVLVCLDQTLLQHAALSNWIYCQQRNSTGSGTRCLAAMTFEPQLNFSVASTSSNPRSIACFSTPLTRLAVNQDRLFLLFFNTTAELPFFFSVYPLEGSFVGPLYHSPFALVQSSDACAQSRAGVLFGMQDTVFLNDSRRLRLSFSMSSLGCGPVSTVFPRATALVISNGNPLFASFASCDPYLVTEEVVNYGLTDVFAFVLSVASVCWGAVNFLFPTRAAVGARVFRFESTPDSASAELSADDQLSANRLELLQPFVSSL